MGKGRKRRIFMLGGGSWVLGRVDKPDPEANAAEQDEAQEAGAGLIVAGSDPAAVFQSADEALDAGAQGVEPPADGVLHLAAALGRDFRLGAAVAGILPEGVAVVCLVAEQHAGVAVTLGHEIVVGGEIMCLAGGQDDGNGKPVSIGAQVDLGREAAARTAKSLGLSPPLAPAAQWCARTMVLSII